MYVGGDAVGRLLDFCEQEQIVRCTLVADPNTHRALGGTLADAWARRGWDAQVTVLNGSSVVADEHYIMQLLIRAGPSNRVFLAIGSGTITDIVRFASFVTGRGFISVPTAPSVDGFTSTGAALTIGQSKQTVRAHAPVAVFADLETLCAAPKPMVAAGFGDMLGKYTSLADWRLGHLLWAQPYSEPIANRTRLALERCMDALADPPVSKDAIRRLMESLLESGQCIADFGSSEAASGSEHHLSHYWEMLLSWEGRPPLLHGAKVAVGTVLVARIYETLRRLARSDAAQRLASAPPPDREQEILAIHSGYDDGAANMIAAHSAFLDMTAADFEALKQRILDHWEAIQQIASTVPRSEELADRLQRLDAPVTPAELGLTGHDAARALRYASYLRNRFTVLKLARLLGLDVDRAILG